MIITILLSILFSLSGHAKTCHNFFAPKNELNYKLEKTSKSKGNVLLIHGLGDSLVQLETLSREFKNAGYSVLRVDLHGHGKNMSDKTPTTIPYENNVRDIARTLEILKFDSPIVIGHSYGGAIAFALINLLKNNQIVNPTRLVMLAPYLRRLDYHLLTGNPLMDMHTEYMMESFMRITYHDYFESQKRENIDELVDVSIATTKGIRNFDLLTSGKKASPDSAIPLLVVGGSKDDIVKYDQIETYRAKLLNEKFNHEVSYIEGDHFFPQNHTKETFKVILDFLKRHE